MEKIEKLFNNEWLVDWRYRLLTISILLAIQFLTLLYAKYF